ncbi:3D-(3,5/4)-trihydroxycyclohexane-1,2-dione acylhydrolase (decyclizing) [Kribbella capetownensis]|uniref:3D-(3,5/4)-trihydroxycyclohexane-1,2-dione acylhydrolase (Decyclizing) n=1 Tax=Kribbella capetownensis TaxID=1572659 RepID=A0A4V2M3T3_9ACTN|nr:3D-(3,5/4)-trihydroxycyclohexane-1,2-dione acylhydrolase (decyclizing) [Kribbella capetownensis]TCC33282.1 3D-(3,5/4)-trihydroxycyclohexane-1,2-dione acylhydrolase (decyclizing) [Kribbella capetownensis]
MTVRLTVAQALVRFLSVQYSERDGERQRLFAGCLGIFGHGNVAGVGQALLQAELEDPAALPYILARNEQAMVHTASAFARTRDRLQTYACTASIGPGSTNMVTGAALATVNRLPVLILPSDVFATRVATPVLQELESFGAGDVSVNDAFRPVSKYFDRIWRPEQLPSALLNAMRVLTDPVETGAVTLALPQDVQAEAYDWPDELFSERTWYVARPLPEASIVDKAVDLLRAAKAPLIVAGGGVHYSGAEDALRRFAETTGVPVSETQAGKGSLRYDHPQSVGAVGSTGTTAANALAREADLVIGIGTRYSDFTTASRTAFQNPDVRFVNINVARFDGGKHAGLPLVADAREALVSLTSALDDWSVGDQYRSSAATLATRWDEIVDNTYNPPTEVTSKLAVGVLTQGEVLGAVNELSAASDVVVCAAGSMPGELHKLWRTRDPKGYHVEYGYSCMGYEIAGGIGVRLGAPDRDVFVLVGDGSYLMMSSELVTAVQENVKIIVVLVQNHGFASIGALSESLGSQRFGTAYRSRSGDGRLDGDYLPVDLAANVRSLGVDVIEVHDRSELEKAIGTAKAANGPIAIHVTTDPLIGGPDSESWWDVPVSEVSALQSTQAASAEYEESKKAQRLYVAPVEGDS